MSSGMTLDIYANGLKVLGFKEAVKRLEMVRQIRSMPELNKYYAKIGILKDKNDRKEFRDAKGATVVSMDGTMTVALVGAFHEFGTRHGIPRRSFLRDPIRNDFPKIQKVAKIGISKFLKDQNAKGVMDLVGEYAKDISVKSFRKNKWEANKPSTIKAKGSSNPLIDTGQLIQSIHYEVKRKADV